MIILSELENDAVKVALFLLVKLELNPIVDTSGGKPVAKNYISLVVSKLWVVEHAAYFFWHLPIGEKSAFAVDHFLKFKSYNWLIIFQ